MPELPEVETIVSELESKITGKELKRFLVKSKKIDRAVNKLEGKRIISVSRRAKIIRVAFEDGLNALIHLKMTGRLFFTKKRERVVTTPYVRAVMSFKDGSTLVFEDVRTFGYIKMVSDKEAARVLAPLGPEPLERSFTLKSLRSILSRFSASRIKPLLLDQTRIAGIGNIYADEILFRARIHPLTRAGSIGEDRAELLHKSIKQILRKAIRLKGSSIESYLTTDGSKGRYDRVRYVYWREGKPCPNRCGGKVKKIKVGGRGTHFCPECQVL